MTMVIIIGGIDLSVGSTLAFSTVIIALLMKMELNPLLSVTLAISACTLLGFINGFIITRLKIVSFIVTLGSLLLIRGLSKGLAGEQKIDAPLSWVNELLATLPTAYRWLILAPGVWLMIILAILIALMLKLTKLGRHIYAVGSNEKAARLCGVPVENVKLIVYCLCGTLTGFAGLLQFSRLTVGDPTVGIGIELDAIAAVVIGGGSLNGGEGSITGSLVGALTMSVIRSGCSQMGLPNWVQEIVTGIIIIIAVSIDRIRHNKLDK